MNLLNAALKRISGLPIPPSWMTEYSRILLLQEIGWSIEGKRIATYRGINITEFTDYQLCKILHHIKNNALLPQEKQATDFYEVGFREGKDYYAKQFKKDLAKQTIDSYENGRRCAELQHKEKLEAHGKLEFSRGLGEGRQSSQRRATDAYNTGLTDGNHQGHQLGIKNQNTEKQASWDAGYEQGKQDGQNESKIKGRTATIFIADESDISSSFIGLTELGRDFASCEDTVAAAFKQGAAKYHTLAVGDTVQVINDNSAIHGWITTVDVVDGKNITVQCYSFGNVTLPATWVKRLYKAKTPKFKIGDHVVVDYSESSQVGKPFRVTNVVGETIAVRDLDTGSLFYFDAYKLKPIAKT